MRTYLLDLKYGPLLFSYLRLSCYSTVTDGDHKKYHNYCETDKQIAITPLSSKTSHAGRLK